MKLTTVFCFVASLIFTVLAIRTYDGTPAFYLVVTASLFLFGGMLGITTSEHGQ